MANQNFARLNEEELAKEASYVNASAVAKIVFIARDNDFNRRFIKELSRAHLIAACMFVEQDRKTLVGVYSRIRKRISKYGFLRVLDELAFHIFDRTVLRKNESAFFTEKPE